MLPIFLFLNGPALAEEFRALKVGLQGNMVIVDGKRQLLTTYSSTGGPVQSGPDVLMSGNLQNVKLDVSALPKDLDPYAMRLATQIDNGTQIVAVQARNRFNNAIYIDSKYNVAKSAGALKSATRLIEIGFVENDTDRTIAASSIEVIARRADGKPLTIRRGRHETFVIDGVPRETLRITVKDRATGKTVTLNLFPYFIEREAGTVLYNFFSLTLGKGLLVDPDYAH